MASKRSISSSASSSGSQPKQAKRQFKCLWLPFRNGNCSRKRSTRHKPSCVAISNKDTLRVCGVRHAGGSKTRFVGPRTSLLPGLPAPPTRSWATSLIMRAFTSITCRCLYCMLSKRKPRIVLSPRTLQLLRPYCPWIDRFRREWERNLTFSTWWQRRTYLFVSIQRSMSWKAAMELI